MNRHNPKTKIDYILGRAFSTHGSRLTDFMEGHFNFFLFTLPWKCSGRKGNGLKSFRVSFSFSSKAKQRGVGKDV
jgi:hypothetical protein